METFYSILILIEKKIIWNPVLILTLFGTGLYLTLRLHFMPIRRLPKAIQLAFSNKTENKGKGEISPRAALFTALSATVGTGNIAGVATAIAIGGPGSIFWMWLMAILGMATKYSECLLAVKYREIDERGEMVGGPMYYIQTGLGKNWKWLAYAFAVFTSIAALMTGNMVQSFEVTKVLNTHLDLPAWGVGLFLSVLIFFVIIGGVKSIASVASKLVPFMAVAYFLCSILAIALNAERIPNALEMIFTHAFTGTAATGGFIGASFFFVLQTGAERGMFSNEAGQGSAPIAHASAKTDDPVRQGSIAMLGCFIDTLVICTLTALVILTAPPVLEFAGTFQPNIFSSDPGVEGQSSGASLTSAAFAVGLAQAGIAGGEWVVTLGLVVFAVTTILGWTIYGERAMEFMFGVKAIKPYRFLWCLTIFLSSLIVYIQEGPGKGIAWTLSSISIGLMTIPNLIALLLLSKEIVSTSRAAGVIGRKKKNPNSGKK